MEDFFELAKKGFKKKKKKSGEDERHRRQQRLLLLLLRRLRGVQRLRHARHQLPRLLGGGGGALRAGGRGIPGKPALHRHTQQVS